MDSAADTLVFVLMVAMIAVFAGSVAWNAYRERLAAKARKTQFKE